MVANSIAINKHFGITKRNRILACISPNSPSPLQGMSKVIIIDHADPAIVYDGSWTKGSAVITTRDEYNSTIHISNTPGDTLTYKFEGRPTFLIPSALS